MMDSSLKNARFELKMMNFAFKNGAFCMSKAESAAVPEASAGAGAGSEQVREE